MKTLLIASALATSLSLVAAAATPAAAASTPGHRIPDVPSAPPRTQPPSTRPRVPDVPPPGGPDPDRPHQRWPREPASTRCSVAPSGMVAGNRLNSEAATYLGTGTADAVNGVAIAADCTIVVAGRLGPLAMLPAPQPLLPGVASSSGLLVELGNDGRSARRQRSFGSVINDIDTNAANGVLVGGDAGVARLSPDLSTVLWSRTDLGGASRVALAADGRAAVLFGKTLRVFDSRGQVLIERPFGDSMVNDVAIDSGGVYVTGLAQRDGGPCSELQVAWVRSYDFANAPRWKAWDWTHAQAAGTSSSCADTRGLRLSIGGDGGLYFAGESAGGNTIYRFQSTSLGESAGNVSTDAYNTAYNTAANHITYIARLDSGSGRVIKGQLLLARLGSGKGNTIRPRAITADSSGRIYVAGVSACCIDKRDALVFNGSPVADYAGGDPWMLVLSPDLRARQLWFSGANGGSGEAFGLAVSRGLAVLGTTSTKTPMVLDRALQPVRPAGVTSSGHVMSWSVGAPE